MTISEAFTTDTFEEAFKVIPVNIKDPKGKDTIAQGTPDMMPILLGLTDDNISHRIMSGKQAGTFIPAESIKNFMDESKTVLDEATVAYVMAAQESLAQEMGVDIAALRESGMEGFQIAPDDPRITEKLLDNAMSTLDTKYPTGPLNKKIIDAVITVAASTLSGTWDKGDNYKCFVSVVIFNTINAFAKKVTTIVNEQVLGPIIEIIQYKRYAAEQAKTAAAQNRMRPAGKGDLVGLAGEKLTSKSINELTLPDSVKQDKIVN